MGVCFTVLSSLCRLCVRHVWSVVVTVCWSCLFFVLVASFAEGNVVVSWCLCVHLCVCACVRPCVRACVRACVCARGFRGRLGARRDRLASSFEVVGSSVRFGAAVYVSVHSVRSNTFLHMRCALCVRLAACIVPACVCYCNTLPRPTCLLWSDAAAHRQINAAHRGRKLLLGANWSFTRPVRTHTLMMTATPRRTAGPAAVPARQPAQLHARLVTPNGDHQRKRRATPSCSIDEIRGRQLPHHTLKSTGRRAEGWH